MAFEWLDDAVSWIPGVGDVTGANARIAGREAAAKEAEASGYYAGLQSKADALQAPDLAWNALGPQRYDAAQEDYGLGQQGNAYMLGAEADQRGIDAQTQALAGMQDIYRQGGLTAADRARMAQVSDSVNANSRGREQSILQNANARGMGGSGAEFAALLGSNQTSAQTGAQMAGDVSRIAEQRALDALSQSGQLGGQIRGQSFAEDAARRTAQDAVDRFNAEGVRQQQARNIGSQNDARRRNSDTTNEFSRWNVEGDRSGRQQTFQNQQALYQNQVGIAAGRAGQAEAAAAASRAAAEASRNRGANLTQAVATGGLSALAPSAKDDDEDED